jgi:spore maturation protein CgeB
LKHSKIKKVLFVSNSSTDGIMHFLDAFLQNSNLDIKVEHLYTNKIKSNFWTKALHKLGIPKDFDRINQRVEKANAKYRPDIIFIVKGNSIYPWTLKRLKKTNPNGKVVSFSNDNMSLWHNKSLYYHLGLSYYDLVVSINIEAYRDIEDVFEGKVLYLDKSFSTRYHYTEELDKAISVVFIGSYEKERYEDLQFLANHGVKIEVFGAMWDKVEHDKISKNIKIHFENVLADDYRKTICSSKIILGFLRKINSDTQTSRTFEIPACGGFMLMERTENQQRLFEEGKEAEYFSSKDELLSKIKYYLAHPEERERIAKRGRARCESSAYSYSERAETILLEIDSLPK